MVGFRKTSDHEDLFQLSSYRLHGDAFLGEESRHDELHPLGVYVHPKQRHLRNADGTALGRRDVQHYDRSQLWRFSTCG